MAALLGSVVAYVTFGVVQKVAGLKGQPPTPVAAINYILAAGAAGAVVAADPGSAVPVSVLYLGLLGGALYVAGFYLSYRATATAGLSMTQPVISIASMVPVTASVLLWGESPSAVQMAAIAGACLSLILLGSSRGASVGQTAAPTRAAVPLLLLTLFAVQGVAITVPKALGEAGYGQQRWEYMAVLFGTAAIGASGCWLRTRDRLTPTSVALGMTFGAANVAANLFLLAALAELPGIVVYPVTSVGSLVLGTSLGIAVWAEKPGARAICGIALAVFAVCFLSF